jgi:WD40 repeat protein/tetratricopeptide (TPR) repeat protein
MLHDRELQSIAFSADGSRILTVSWNRKPLILSPGASFDESTTHAIIRVWDAGTAAPIGRAIPFPALVAAASLSPDGGLLVVALPDASVSVLDLGQLASIGTAVPAYSLRLEATASRLRFSPDGSRFLCIAGDSATLWDAATGAAIGPPRRQRAPISLALFAGDGARFLTASREGPLRVWDATTGAPLGGPLATGLDYGSLRMAPDGRRFLTLSGTSVRLWALSDGRLIDDITLGSRATSAAFTRDGSLFAVAFEDGNVDFRRSETGERAGDPLHIGGKIDAMDFSPNGEALLTGGADGAVQLFRVRDGQRILLLRHAKAVRSVAYSADGASILTASADGRARLWGAASGAPIGDAMSHGDEVMSAAFAPDGGHIVTASMDRSVGIWDAATGKPSGPALDTDLPAKLALPSADGLRLLTLTGPDRRHAGVTSLQPWLEPTGHETVQLWQLSGAQPEGQPILRENGAAAAALSSDGTRLATGMSDRSARLFDTATAAPLGPAFWHDSSVLSVAFAPQGNRLVALSWSAARIWSVGEPPPPPGERAAIAYLATVERPDDRLVRRFRLALPPRNRRPSQEVGCVRSEDVEHPSRPFRITQGADSDPDWEAWRRACEEALAAAPRDAGLRYQLGRALFELDRGDDAVAAFREAEAAGSAAAALALGRLAVADGDGARAAAEFRSASRLGAPRGDAWLAERLWKAAEPPEARGEALALWRSAAQRKDSYALERLAVLEEGDDIAGGAQAALRDWAMLVEIESRQGIEDPYALARRASLARYLTRTGKADLAAKAWREAKAALAAPQELR